MIDLAALASYAFHIDVPAEVLQDLRSRLERTRWPIEPQAAAWRYGTDGAYLRSVVDHWTQHYDWHEREQRLNRFRHYRIPVDGLKWHVLVEPSSGPSPAPLLLLNGWPSCFTEFADIIDPLAHPERFGHDVANAFTVIVASYPGFGFSDPPAAPVGARDIARSLDALLSTLIGSQSCLVHGGDWGSIIGSWLAFDAPQRVAALHLNAAPLRPPLDGLVPDTEELAFLEARAARLVGETGYQAIQSSKPQTLSYGLTDSPVGLAGWILEKFQAWVVAGSNKPPPFAIDVLLDIVMIYWLNGIGPANWIYCDLADGRAVTLPPHRHIRVPTALLTGGHDLGPPPPSQWVRRSYNLVERHHLPEMGHFPSIEPSAMAHVDHMRGFFRRYRSSASG